MNALIDWLLRLYTGLLLAFLFAPILTGVVFSFNDQRFPSLPLGGFTTDWYAAVLGDAQVWDAFANSAVIGVCAATLATLIGFAAAYTDYRFRFRGKQVLTVVALIPPTIPLVIMGLAMLAFLSRIGLAGTVVGIAVSHIVLCAPFAMAVIRLRLSQMDAALEPAAQNLGATDWVSFARIVLPFVAPALLAAFFLSLAVSFDEFAVAWFVGGLNETVPVRILNSLQGQVSPTIHAIGTLTFLTSMTLILGVLALLPRTTEPADGA